MWFKQVQIIDLPFAMSQLQNDLAEKMKPFAFRPCLPHMLISSGWVSPCEEEEGELFRVLNDCMMLCLQIEEKILPATVIRQEWLDVIKQMELSEDRKLRHKEKQSLKDEIIQTLLPRAFTKISRHYAYIDKRHQRLIMGSANNKISDHFINLFKKSIHDQAFPHELKKVSSWMTNWLRSQQDPACFTIEKACVLQDPQQENRIIRCQSQDVFASPIQTFLKEGCEVVQLALTWQDRVQFVLQDDFSLRSIQFLDEIKEEAHNMQAESKQQQFDADFIIMTSVLSQLLNDLLAIFQIKSEVVAA